MSEDKNPREYWLLQYDGDAFIYESLDEFPPDGDKSLLVHVREVIDETKQADASTRKYEFTGETKDIHNCIVRQIRLISDGEIGGWIESEKNLSHEGDCWIGENACVTGNARVSHNARVFGDAFVSGSAWVSDNARVSGDAIVSDIARVSNNAKVSGDAMVCGKARVFGDVMVTGDAIVCGNAIITGNDILSSNVQVFGCGDD
jgi:carbonic anhydrase/acetyltransferase-like protein (isoleucine patch superfamily)